MSESRARPLTQRLVPTLIAGVVGAGTVAVAAGRAVANVDGAAAGQALAPNGAAAGTLPLAQALALVTLACWGVILVTRERSRSLIAVIGALAALGTVVGVGSGARSAPEAVREQAVLLDPDASVHLTGWFWLVLVGAVLSLVATVVAVRSARTWPEMGRRYDAPVTSTAGVAESDNASNTDLWRALDEGRDPTT